MYGFIFWGKGLKSIEYSNEQTVLLLDWMMNGRSLKVKEWIVKFGLIDRLVYYVLFGRSVLPLNDMVRITEGKEKSTEQKEKEWSENGMAKNIYSQSRK